MFSVWPAWVIGIGLILGAYLCGAIPFGLLVGGLKGVDIRTRGSGNIGATNVGRVLGKSWGVSVFVLDVLKGFLPTMLAGMLIQRITRSGGQPGPNWLVHLLQVAIASACILGHMFPVYLKFKGGKGVATSLGALLGIYPFFTLPALLAFALWVVLTLASRYVSVGSIASAAAFPIIFVIFAYFKRGTWGTVRQLWPLHLFGIIIATLVVYRHRSNIRRLLEGSEPQIGTSRKGRI